MVLRLFTTLSRQIEEFHSIVPGQVGLYACGPTVWNYAHIGNLRTYLFEDLLVRTLRFLGYQVKHVMNVTDVGHLTDDADQGEDKMLKGARERGSTVWEIAQFFTTAFFRDLEELNIEKPSIICRATDHIEDMIALIARLEQQGFTYRSAGNLYFDISRLPDYGKLTGQNLEALKAGARIEVDANKRNPLDFVLWFTRSKFEHQAMLWDSPWGRGYPGWHIECSAMSVKYLGEQFDIHCGGIDHIPVHHTNEIAQTEGATGRKWVNYWLHGEFLVLAREKMAKSAHNFLTLSSLKEQGYYPLDYRYFCLGAHYRSQLQFSFAGLEAARSARRNLVERLGRLLAEMDGGERAALQDSRAQGEEKGYLEFFADNLAGDLNAPKGLADLWGLVKDEGLSPAARMRGARAMDRILGLGLDRVEPIGEQALDEESRAMIEERSRARALKKWARADAIREALRQKGVLVEDTLDGVRWKKL